MPPVIMPGRDVVIAAAARRARLATLVLAACSVLAGCAQDARSQRPTLAARQGAVAHLSGEDPPPGAETRPVAVSPSNDDVVAAGQGVQLTWRPVRAARGTRFYVEVVDDGGNAPKTVFHGYASGGSVRVTLASGAGHYRWRVYAVSPRSHRYQTSEWASFMVSAGG